MDVQPFFAGRSTSTTWTSITFRMRGARFEQPPRRLEKRVRIVDRQKGCGIKTPLFGPFNDVGIRDCTGGVSRAVFTVGPPGDDGKAIHPVIPKCID